MKSFPEVTPKAKILGEELPSTGESSLENIAEQTTTFSEETAKNELTNKNDESAMIEKAVAFWNHPAIKDIPSEDKRVYLIEQQGLTTSQIHKVWEHLVESKNESNSSRSNTGESLHPSPLEKHPHFSYSEGRPRMRPPGMYDRFSNHGIDPVHGSFYGHPQYTQSQNLLDSEDVDESISIARGISLMGVGGFLGVTGAAAVRWLNGGSFELIPPPSATTISKPTAKILSSPEQESSVPSIDQGQQSTVRLATTDENDEQSDQDFESSDEYSDGEESEDAFENHLLERMDTLLSSIDSNSVLQEKLLSKLANTSTITDQSMNLLKQQDRGSSQQETVATQPKGPLTSTSNSSSMLLLNRLQEDLKEMREDLRHLCSTAATLMDIPSNENNTSKEWQKRSTALFEKLDQCLERIANEECDDDSQRATNSVATTTQTESSFGNTSIDKVSMPTAELTEDKECIPPPPPPSTPGTGGDASRNNDGSPKATTKQSTMSLKDSIIKVAEQNDALTLRSGTQLLYLYLANLSGKPDNRRYRKIFVSNESFRKVENLSGGKDVLKAVGFVEDTNGSSLEWVPSGCAEEEIHALVLVREAAAALGVFKKTTGMPTSECIASALSKLSCAESDISSSSQSNKSIENNNRASHLDEDVPQTPAGSSLLSPPMPKKLPFFPTPTGKGDS